MNPKRQTEEENACFVGNDQLSCYPTAGTSIQQDQWGKFVWNRNYPDFTNSGGNVDVYLFHQDSDQIVERWLNVSNELGRISFSPVDKWWQNRIQADNFNGTNINWPFYFVITAAGKGLAGPLDRQPTFNGVQTALPASVEAARISSSLAAAASSSSSAAAATATITRPMNATSTMTSAPTPPPTALPTSDLRLASGFAASLTSALISSLNAANATGTQSLHSTATTTLPDGAVITASATAVANGTLRIPEKGTSLPDYAIVLIVVFGLLTLAGIIVAIYFCLRAARRRSFRDHIHRDLDIVSGGSNTPFIEHTSDDSGQNPQQMREVDETRHSNGRYSDSSMINRANEGLSATEVWRLANAFRSALRKPRFSSNTRSNSLVGNHEFNSGVTAPELNTRDGPILEREAEQEADRSLEGDTTVELLLRDELAREGKSIRLVPDRKKPELHGG